MMAGYWSQQIHAAAFELVRNTVPPPAKVLDVGAGHGAFSKRLTEAGYNTVAIEGFVEFQVPTVKCYRANLNEDWPTDIGEPFDVIVAIEIIEHLENPFHFARQARAKLHPNGKIVITSPNPLNILSRWKFLFKGNFDMLEHNDHLTVILPRTIDLLSQKSGFRIIKRTFDVDPLKVHSSWRGYIGKKASRLLSLTFMRGHNCLEGNSNIWLLEAV